MNLLSLAVGTALVVLNTVGLVAANYFSTLVFLDTIGTAIAGLGFGWWQGALVGLATNLVIGVLLYPPYLRFFYVNLLCGAAWGLIRTIIPPPITSPTDVIVYIVAIGAVVGALSAILSAPLRIHLGFHTNHVLDQLSQDISGGGLLRFSKVACVEYLVSHLLDKTISTTVGVMFVLEFQQRGSLPVSLNVKGTYHDLIDLLAAYYFVAMGIAIKSLGVKYPQMTEPVVAVLGPLGFFMVLIGLPVIFETIGVN